MTIEDLDRQMSAFMALPRHEQQIFVWNLLRRIRFLTEESFSMQAMIDSLKDAQTEKTTA